jgi:hypothetical protein
MVEQWISDKEAIMLDHRINIVSRRFLMKERDRGLTVDPGTTA